MNSRPRKTTRRVASWIAIFTVVALALLPARSAMAQEHESEGIEAKQTHTSSAMDPSRGLLGIGAGLAIGLTALATGIAQARIGAAGVGAIAENPKRLGVIIMLVAIPETVAILGFVIAYLILS